MAGVRHVVPMAFAAVSNSAEATSSYLKSAYVFVSVITVATSTPERRLIVMTSCEKESMGPEAITVEAAA